MGTIVQEYGPFYGEPVNGTVQGRPNGSVYVPITNTITFTATEYLTNYLVGDQKRVRFCDSDGRIMYYQAVAVAQDLASNIRIGLFADAELTTLLGSNSNPAGQFNVNFNNVVANYELDADTTYYVVAQLMNNDVPVATSNVYVCSVVVS